jgi:putative aminopeptidase FrvX
MLDAHSDEVGFMVHSIKPNGTLRFIPLGGWNKNSLVSARVLVRNALDEYIPGIIASKPVHFMSAAERANPALEIRDMVIDIGATSAQEAVEKYHVRIGEPIVPDTQCRYDEQNGVFFGKAFDCRIGCAVLLEVLRRLEGKELPCDVVGVLSSQEEVGERGCKVAVNHVKPAAAVVLEGCPADDTFTEGYAIQTALKKGPMFRFMDVSVICNPRFQRYALNLAEEKGLPVQASVREGGGNNAAVIQTALEGIPAIVGGVPVRYIHSMNGMCALFDFEATVNVVQAILESLTPEIIASF